MTKKPKPREIASPPVEPVEPPPRLVISGHKALAEVARRVLASLRVHTLH